MASSNFDQDNVVRCKMNRRDIALVFIAVLVLIQGAVTVYIIVANKQTTNGELQTKLQMQQDEIEKQQDENKKQKDEIKEHQDKLTSIYSELEKAKTNQGVVYVRWGRKDCPGNGTETVYSGYAGGSYYNHAGAAVDYVCLPPDPSWGPKKDIRSYAPGYMYGAEYEDEVLFNKNYKNKDVPCAVCRSSNQSTSIMIPARTTCYTGWDEAYHGYLASGYNSHVAASQYVCVDEIPQALIGGGSSDDNGKLFYQVRTRCGSLKCPPYEEDKVLSCVVCMK
ncbi:short-chain collagen C4-like [Mizuhopecten yessoensis]|uniref:Short-chain collagen C4 n=1 Tax=Mizuhopecten yessoensis TaxID=6573 RepID=A0A210Q637_MIZYE|nr:short-chain collagen C4-like [Mizuhopecten yessoensis]OWF44181.1 Short-chain collagen C4 [Mizuhopecten yessoensis]